MTAIASRGLSMITAGLIVSGVLAIDRGFVVSLIAIAAFVLYGMYRVRMEITHPAVWLPPFIYVYHYNVVILHLMQLEHLEHPFQILWIGWISIFTSVMMFVVFGKASLPHENSRSSVGLDPLIIRIGYGLTLLMLLQVCLKYFSAGYTDKSQFHLAQSMPELSYVPLWFSLFYALWFVRQMHDSKLVPWTLVLFTGGFTLFCTLALGERDIFLCFCAATMFLLFHYSRVRKTVLVGLGVLIAGPLLTILHFLRNVFSGGSTGFAAFNDQGMMLSFLYGEFIAGGRNLDIILSNSQWWDFFYGGTPLWVLEHKLFPGVMVETRNSSLWFHQNFLPDWVSAVGGYGFTFSGDGFINFSLLGVALWYAVLSGVIITLYNRRGRSGLALSIYVVTAPLAVWTMRATMLYLPGAAMLILQPVLLAVFAQMIIRALHHHRLRTQNSAGHRLPEALT